MTRGEESTASVLLLSAGVAVAGLVVMSAVFGLAWVMIR
jgi:hypothetical protein